MDNWWVYIVEKKTGLYVGITTDLENRMRQHGQAIPLYHEGPFQNQTPSKRKNPQRLEPEEETGADGKRLSPKEPLR